MIAKPEQNVSFAEFELDRARRRLFRDGEPVVLYAKTFDLLNFLVERNGEVVSKDEILEAVWPGQFVEEANLSVQMSTLRKALGETTSAPRFLVTIPGVGYKFVGDTHHDDDEIVIDRHTMERVLVTDDAIPEITQLPGATAGWRRPLMAFLALAVFAVVATVAYRYFATAPTSQIRSIAVLPFKPLVAADRNESLEMGMADTLIAKLSSLPEVNVRPITAVRGYSAIDQDAVAAGREQLVDAVLDGQIQQSGEKIRMTVRFVRVDDGSLIWTDQFDEKFSDIFDVQNSISQRVTNTLAVKLTGEQKTRLAKRYTEDPEAYELYVMGQLHYGRRTREGMTRSIEYFNQAIAKDPSYALAYAALGEAYSTMGWIDYMPPHEAYAKAKKEAENALALDDSVAAAHGVLANIKRGYDWDLAGAEAEYRRALELDPNDPTTHQWYGLTLACAGRHDESIEHLRRARELDPLSVIINKSLGDMYAFARRFDEAIAQYKHVIELEPNSPLGYRELGVCYYYKGMHDEAINAWLKVATLSGLGADEIDRLKDVYKTSGIPGIFRESAKRIERTKTPYLSSYDVASRYSAAGDKELALDWLERAYDEHSSGMVAVDVDLLFDNIRHEPRFLELRRRVGLPQN